MASTSSTIRIIFDGAIDGLRRAVRQAEQDLRGLDEGLERNRRSLDTFDRVGDGVGRTVATMTKAFVGLGAASSAIQSVVVVAGTLASVTAELAPAALALPGIFLGIGVAVGTAKIALLGVADAIKGDAEALAKLSPAAKDVVGAIRGLEGGFNKLKAAVQEDFFAGLAIEIKETGKALLDVGQKSLPNVASGFNAMAVEALRAARTPFFTGALTKIIDNTALGLGNMKNSVANVLTGFIGLGSVGSKFLPAIGKAIDDVAQKFNDWVQKGINDGSIERMIDRAIEGFKTLGRILDDVGDGVRVMLDAFNRGLGGSGGTLESVERLSAAFEEFASSGRVQSFLETLGDVIKTVGDAFREVLQAALEHIMPIFEELAPFIKAVAEELKNGLKGAIETVGPLLESLARFLSDNKDQIAPLVPLLIPLAAGFLAIKLALRGITGLAALSAAFATLRAALAGGLAARLLAVAGAIGRFLWPVAAFAGLALFADYINNINLAAAGGDPEKLGDMEQSLNDLVEAGKQLASGDLEGAMRDIGAEWDTLVQKFKDGESPAGAAFAKIKESFQRDVIDFFGPGLTKIKESFQKDFIDFFAHLPENLAANFTILKDTLVRNAELAFEEFKATIKRKLEEANKAIQDFFTLPSAFDVGAWLGQLIIDTLNGFTGWIETIKTKLGEADKALETWVTVTVPATLATLPVILAAKAIEAWESFKATCAQKMAEVVAFVLTLPARIGGAIAALPGILLRAALTAWNSFFGETKSGGTRSTTEAGTVPNKIGSALAALPGILLEKARAAWQGWLTEQAAKITRIIEDAKTLPSRVAGAIGNLASTLVASGASLMQGFIDGINSKLEGIRQAAAAAAAAARSFFPFSPAKEGPFSGRGWTLYSGQALADAFADGIRRSTPGVAAATSALAAIAAADLNSFEIGQLARLQRQTASRAQLGDLVTRMTASAAAVSEAPISVTVLLSPDEVKALARVEVTKNNQTVARLVGAGSGQSF